MRRLTAVLGALLFIFLLVAVNLKPAVVAVTKWQLQRTLNAKTVSIGDCRINFRQVDFRNVEVRTKFQDTAKINEAVIGYSFLSLVQGRVLQVSLQGVSVKGPFAETGLEIDNGEIVIKFNGSPGNLFIPKLQYNKFKIENVRARTKMQGGTLVLDEIWGQVLKGILRGGLAVKISKSPIYLADLKLINVDLKRFVEDFNLSERMTMDGLLSGRLSVNGQGITIKMLNGKFTTSSNGGLFIIKDTSYIKSIARSADQPLNIVVDSLKDYHYNTSIARLYLEQGAPVLDMVFEGKTGKRSLKISWHDLSST